MATPTNAQTPAADARNLSPTERIKQRSDALRGTLVASLENEITGAISEDDTALLKFHGMYQQDDRDRREERAEKKLERLYSFMIRLRLPGGFMTPEQWIATHHIAGEYSTGTIKITTRQTLQLHGLLKSKIKPTIQSFSKIHLDSIAACGDVNRNVVCAAHPMQSAIHEQVHAYAARLSQYMLPKTRAYYEIWLDEEKLTDKQEENDPLYQDRYLPRKFKIALGIPPNNDIDVLANDLALIAIIENDELKGFNIAIGGGLGATHGNPDTYPRLASVIGYLSVADGDEKLFKAAYEIITIQRDYGNRTDRKLARLKYTIDKYGLDWYKQELEKRTGFALEAARPFEFTDRVDYYGWEQNHQGLWYYTPFIESGRILDDERLPLKTALLEIAQTGKANFRFTCNQNLILADIRKKDKASIEKILHKYGIIAHTEAASAIRKNSIACVALPTCGLALAEAQRYLPSLIGKIEPLLGQHGLSEEKIIIRMTGCPNGCGRPYTAEIGLVGTAPGRYNMHLGADHEGTRLNRLYKENLDEATILSELDLLFRLYKKERATGETFGDFALRQRWYKW
ncbi:MAG: NADPH-dependent assimilatory sulfite reductase hemoprotein subunit [Bacteroidota bacterium]|nr:NADPH-dependent assimilatory sulfite reductase hemoprotein subunit [Bacteroidota bacterium]MDP4217448.1 NADPH-dependent assimilatory sulfite reductase hemoprotein subunit [Bacteroidota bacterium]MDP4246386.1 NADPH-dependent assimilatory sulfite reductase hemoprotein subunit [Bacteroidota bacterium]MDP4259244.1 NADPH-dependent assimilatory sulfite reductase hemoprotein subunit [Bacteroidota bacterium]